MLNFFANIKNQTVVRVEGNIYYATVSSVGTIRLYRPITSVEELGKRGEEWETTPDPKPLLPDTEYQNLMVLVKNKWVRVAFEDEETPEHTYTPRQ